MKKKIAVLLIFLLLVIPNVNAKKITIEEYSKIYEETKNSRGGVINIPEALVPVILIGICLIVNNISDNKKNDNQKNNR